MMLWLVGINCLVALRDSQVFFRTSGRCVLFTGNFVRSLFDYGTIVWNPSYAEAIHRKFLKYLCFKFNVLLISENYKNIQEHFGFSSLDVRR